MAATSATVRSQKRRGVEARGEAHHRLHKPGARRGGGGVARSFPDDVHGRQHSSVGRSSYD
jgi:hypothetical protein